MKHAVTEPGGKQYRVAEDDVIYVEKLPAAAEGNERAQLPLDKFAYKVRKYIGTYAAALGGVDMITFTAGMGENSASMRERICKGLEYLGVKINPEKTRLGARRRRSPPAKVRFGCSSSPPARI